jgi:hypothetical protein
MLILVMRIVVFVLLVVSACAQATPLPVAAHPTLSSVALDRATPKADVSAAVLQLPVIGQLDGPTPVVLRGHVSRGHTAALLGEARGVYADVSRRFLGSSNHLSRTVHVCIFEEDPAYRAFVREVFGEGHYSSLGFYRADARVAVVNLSRGIGNLRHELVHPLLADDFPGIPAWLNEGVGALYGTAYVESDRVTFLLNYRLRDLQNAIQQGTLPDFTGMTNSTGVEVRGEHAAIYYAMARYLLLYLERRGRLDAFYRDARDGEHDSAAMLRLLREAASYNAFVAWARKLRRPL